ncbi:gypsy/ty3 retroelement polyprotein [Tanacetum coccineum]
MTETRTCNERTSSSAQYFEANNLAVVLNTMQSQQLFAKMSKCVFGTSQVEYLGHVISRKGVSTDPSKVKALQEWPVPVNIKRLRGFLGLTGYYRRFIKGYATISKPLIALLKKNLFEWTNVAQQAFEDLKITMLIEGIRAVLQQQGHLIAFLSRSLAPRHKRLFTYEKELWVVVYALEKWRRYLLDRHFKIKTDHFSLKYLMEQRLTTPFQIKWLPKLLGYDYEIIYKKGSENIVTDALSSWLTDPSIQQVINQAKDGGSSTTKFSWQNEQLRRNGRLVIGYDAKLRAELLKYYHNEPIGGHSGVEATYKRLSKYSHFIPLSHPFKAAQIAQVFLDSIYKLHGLPQTITSDRDKLSIAYHPRTYGQSEVVNRCLECYLRCMTSEQSREWVNWLALVEFWYNINHHTAINTTPFEVVYGQKPPTHVSYMAGDSQMEAVDRSLRARKDAISLLQFHLERAQHRMKTFTDKNRSDRCFQVGDWVLLKLQPHRQVTLRMHKLHKFSPKFYGPFQVIKKCRQVAYKLQLPDNATVYNVFHVSQLKSFKGDHGTQIQLPYCTNSGLVTAVPVAIIDMKKAKVRNVAVVYWLVQWSNGNEDDATWEVATKIEAKYPDFNVDS